MMPLVQDGLVDEFYKSFLGASDSDDVGSLRRNVQMQHSATDCLDRLMMDMR